MFKVRAMIGYYIRLGVPTTQQCREELRTRVALLTTTTTNEQALWDTNNGALAMYAQLYKQVNILLFSVKDILRNMLF